MRVFLTGGTGFVGSHMLRRLTREGHHVRAIVRDPRKAEQRFGRSDSVEFVAGDVVTGEGLREGIAGCDAVIHLVGIILESGNTTFEKVHHEGTRSVLLAAKDAAIQKFVQMSALGARPNGVSAYQTTKWKAEEVVRKSGLNFTILRPSIIFGPGDGFVTQMVQVMRSAPLFRPVVGNGRYPFRPIYIDDVVDCFVQSLASGRATNQTIELGGPQELTLEELLKQIADCVGVRKPAVHVPFSVMYWNAAVLERIMQRPPVTTEQLRMLKEGSTCDIGPMLRTFDVHPLAFRDGLKRYLC